MNGWRGALVLLLLIIVSVLFFAYSGLPPEPAPQSASGRMLKSGIYAVGDIDYHLIDTTRATPANGDFSGLGHRELDTRVWFPEVERGQLAPGRHPLLVYSHGLASNKIAGAYLAAYLARQGYIVLAADYPLTRLGAPGGPQLIDVVNQPGDISFLLDTLLQWDRDPDSPFYQRIDAERIGVVGVSLGGMTSTLVAYHPRWRDRRVKLAISIAGPSSMFTARFFQGLQLPFMMLASTEDAFVSYTSNALPIPEKMPEATLVTIENGSHTGYSGLTRYLRWLKNPDAIACRYVGGLLQQRPIEAHWTLQLGSQEEGIAAFAEPPPCQQELPAVINPVLQQWLTTLIVFNFLQQQFALTAVEIAAAHHYLHRILPREFTGVVVAGGRSGR